MDFGTCWKFLRPGELFFPKNIIFLKNDARCYKRAGDTFCGTFLYVQTFMLFFFLYILLIPRKMRTFDFVKKNSLGYKNCSAYIRLTGCFPSRKINITTISMNDKRRFLVKIDFFIFSNKFNRNRK